MKKITLMFFMMVLSLSSYAQLPMEQFDTWPVGAGGWAIYQNDVGTNLTWDLSPLGSTAVPPYSGDHAAYLNRQNIPAGNPVDWLITKQFPVPANPQLRFFTRLIQGGTQGNIFDIRISESADQMAVGNYVSLIDSDGWTEDEMLPDVQTVYAEKVIPIPASYIGKQVYIAFIMTAPNINSDRWLIDDVSVLQQCLNPTGLQANNVGLLSAELTWGNPSGATSWEVEIVPVADPPTGSGTVYSGPLPYEPALQAGTAYKFYVRALCGAGNTSDWVGPVNFTTIPYGATCAAPIDITALPYSTNDNTSGYRDDYNGSPGATGCGTTANFLNGNDVVYAYTATFTGIISINMTNNGANSGMFVYTSCGAIGTNCVAGGTGNATTPVLINNFGVTSGQTYYIVISTSGTTLSTPYTLIIQQVNCAQPANGTAVPGETTAQLSWSNPGGATSWQVAVDPAGSPIPAGDGETAGTNTNFPVGGLDPGTQYQFYVRADCGNGTFSAWAGPYFFNTSICPAGDQCNYSFILTDSFSDGWTGGGAMSVRQNGITLQVLTLVSGGGPLTVTVPLCNNTPFELFWDNGGTWPGDIGIAVQNNFGQPVYTKPPGVGTAGSSLFTGPVDCDTPLCLAPTGLTVTNPTTNSAQIGWAGPATGTWEYLVLPPNSPAPTDATEGTDTTTNPTPVGGLDPGTNYVFYVRLQCSNGNSPWAGPFSFFTTQIPATLNYTQDFEGANSGWALNNGTQTNKWVVGSAAANGGTKSLYISNDNGVSNAYDVNAPTVVQAFRDVAIPTGAGDINLSFDWRSVGEGAGFPYDYFRVWVVPVAFTPTPGTQITAGGGRTQVGGNFNVNPAWTNSNFTINATAWAGTVRRFVIEWRNDDIIGDQPPAAIDNINISLITCRVPTNPAVTAGSITLNSATLTWTAPTNSGTPTYDYYLSTSNTPPTGATTPTQENHPTTSVTINTLQPSTTYYFWVRSDCGDPNGTSFWVGPLQFNTPQIPATLNYTDTFEGPFNWTLNNGTQTNKWVVGEAVNNGGTKSIYISNTNGATNNYANTTSVTQVYRDIAITAGVDEIEVMFDWRAVGEGSGTFMYDYFRVWMVPVAFTPTPGTQIAAAAGRYQLTPNLNQSPNFVSASYTVNAQPFDGTTMRLVFEWRNDAFGAFQPPAAIDNVNVVAVTCRKPQTLTAANPTQTSAQLGWTEMNGSTSWFIVVQPVALPAPPLSEPGVEVPGTNPTFLADELEPGTLYEFYVRTDCGDPNGMSTWAGPFTFATLISNDECDDAITVPVNPGIVCTDVVSGTVIGATASTQGNTCFGTDDDDVWFEFTATAATHAVSLENVAGSTTDLYHVVYEGDQCGSLTQLYCSDANNSTFNNFVPGNVYKIRVYSWSATTQTSTFDVCVRTPPPPISVTQTQTVEELVTDVLFGSGCAIVTNITSGTGPGTNNGIGYFNQNGSNFVMADPETGEAPEVTDGVILVSGDAMQAVGPNDFPAGWANGFPGWAGDADLENAVGLNAGDTNDATFIAFNFVPLIEDFRFQFLFASEEYNAGSFECDYSDSFAFILTNVATGVVTNLAVLPGTNTPIQVTNIHPDNTTCDAINEQYFGQYNDTGFDAINFNGQTTTMLAEALVEPGQLYNIKLVVANARDNSHNSAVFLLANSFQIGDISIGVDLLIEDGNAVCDGGEVTLDSQLSAVDYEFEWLQDGETIPGETGPTLTVTEPGDYTLIASYIGSECSGEATVTVEFYPALEDVTADPDDLRFCDPSGFATFDLTQNTDTMLEGLTASDYNISYHLTQEDAENGDGDLDLSYQNTTQFLQTIYVRIESVVSGCAGIKSFDLIVEDFTPVFTINDDFSFCEGNTGTIEVVPGNFDLTDTGITYVWTMGSDTLAETGSTLTVTETGTYQVTITNVGCSASQSVTVTVTEVPVVDEPADVATCDSYELPVLATGNYYTEPLGAGTMLNAGDVITTTQTLYVYAQSGTTPNCTDEHTFTITINQTPVVNNPGDQVACNTYTLPVLTGGNYYTEAGGAGTMLNAGDEVTSTQTIYIYAASGSTPDCVFDESFTVTINQQPDVDDLTDVTVCDSYTLPALTTGNYYTETGGAGTMLNAGDEVTTTQTLYIYAQAGDATCSDESSFTVTVNSALVPQVDDVTACNSYMLPALASGNYYTATNGGGTMLNAGDMVTTSQTIYVFAQSGTTPNCTAETSFDVNIVPAPIVDTPADVTVCDSYMLPALTTGSYYTATGGGGTMLNAGDMVTSTQTIYVYAQTLDATCSDESSFIVTVNFAFAPQLNDVTACNIYTLQPLASGNYYTGMGGTGTMLNAGDVITTSQTIYVYAQSGTTPNCTAETEFDVNIVLPPVVDTPADVTVCNSYILPALGVGNYYTGPGGSGDMLTAGTEVTTSQTLYVYASAGSSCDDESTFNVNVTATPDLDDDDVVQGCDGNNYMLEVNFDGQSEYTADNTTIVWTDPNGNVVGSGESLNLSELGGAAGTYYATVTPTGSTCGVELMVPVTSTSCNIQRGISPNGDGLNEYFDLTALDVTKLSIFNRYGTKVFGYGAYTNQWHGQGDNGNELPTGTYFYSIERANGENVTGWVYINREER